MVRAHTIATLLTPTLGREKSDVAVATAIQKLGIKEEDLSPDQANAVLDELAREAGVVGAAARFARQRSVWGKHSEPESSQNKEATKPKSSPKGAVSSTGRKEEPTPTGLPRTRKEELTPTGLPKLDKHVSIDDLIPFLASALGEEKSREVLGAAAKRVGVTGKTMDHAAVAALFDDLTKQEGQIGISASFARARILLKLGGR